MAEGHGRRQWATASLLAAVIANAHRDPKKGKTFKPTDFNPYEQHDEPIAIDGETIGLMKEAFTEQKGL